MPAFYRAWEERMFNAKLLYSACAAVVEERRELK